jgi:hypothetical protein
MENTRKKFFIITILLVCLFGAGAFIIRGYDFTSQSGVVANAGFLADIASVFHSQNQEESAASTTVVPGDPGVFSSLPSLPSSTVSDSSDLSDLALLTSISSGLSNSQEIAPPSKTSPVLTETPRGPAATPIQDLGLSSVFANWIAGSSSSMTADTSLYTTGNQSLSLTTDGVGDPADARVLDQGPYNLTNKYLEIWIRVSSTTDVDDLYFMASSDDLQANYYTWKLNTQFNTSPDDSEIQAGEWVPIVLTFDSSGEGMALTGAPDVAALNSFGLHVSDRRSGPLTVWLGGISAVAEPPQAVLSIVLDNGWISEYTLAMPTLARYDFPAVIAEIPETANDPAFMTTQQVQYLQNDLGWDITCHTWDHAYQLGSSSVTIPIMDSEFVQCKDWLMQNGLGKASNILVWPNGSNSPEAIAEASKYFVAARGIVGTTFNTLPVANPMLLYATELGGTTPTSTLDADVDRCMANHEWCIFYGHIITTSTPTDQDQYASSSFNDFVAHIAQVGIPVKTLTDVLANEPNLPAPSEASLQSPSGVASQFSADTTSAISTSTPGLAVPYAESGFIGDTNWHEAWGSMTVASSGYMNMGANASTTGATIYLANSTNWSNYVFGAVFDWVRGKTVDLIANYVDDDNYVTCEFDDTVPGQVRVTLEQYMHGKRYVLGEGTDLVENGVGETNIHASIGVQGTQEVCSFNNHVVTSQNGSTINPPYSGGIGFSLWDPTLNNSTIVVKSVAVK